MNMREAKAKLDSILEELESKVDGAKAAIGLVGVCYALLSEVGRLRSEIEELKSPRHTPYPARVTSPRPILLGPWHNFPGPYDQPEIGLRASPIQRYIDERNDEENEQIPDKAS